MESDSSAIEAVLVGFAAGDPDYTRAAKLDIHSFITAKWKGTNIDMSAPDAVVRKQLKAIKQEFGDDREKAKRGGHGTNYLLSPFGLHDEYPEAFPRQRDAQAFQDFYFGAFPKVRQWQFDTLQRAHRDGYLDNHFHYRHHFFAVLAWDKDKSAWKMGDDAKRAVAFVPQSDGSAIQTEYLLDLWQDEMVRQWMRLIIHDSIVLEVPESYLDIACEKVYGVMTKPLPELNGLSIGAEVKYGPNLGEMELWEPPAKKPADTADIGKEAHNVCSNS
jgi:DNA polymerase I-like protein with 3'-5' exonuclease and polymerase domains